MSAPLRNVCQSPVKVTTSKPLTLAWLLDITSRATEFRFGTAIAEQIEPWVIEHELYMQDGWEGLDDQLQADCIVYTLGCKACGCAYAEEHHLTGVRFS